MQTGYDEETLHVEELDELFKKLTGNGVAEDWQEDREIEVELERDEETDTYVQE